MKYTFGNIREVEEKKIKEWDEMRYREFIISSSVKDRHRTVVNVDKWDLKTYALNPIVGYMHDVYGGRMCSPDDPDTLIGTSKVWIEEGKVSDKLPEGRYLMGGVNFETEEVNPLAEKIFKKVKSGSLRMTSVGFMELGTGKYGEGDEKMGGKNETYYFEGQELLEWSIVKIPSNSTAVARTITNQADWALTYILKFMPENVSMQDVRKMSVQQVLDHVNGKVTEKEIENIENAKSKKLEMRLSIMKHELNLI
jgi:hypothetical protein